MVRKLILSGLAALLLSACSKEPLVAQSQFHRDSQQVSLRETAAAPEKQQRFVAVSHRLVVEVPEADLPKAWESAVQFCSSVRCEVLSSAISNRTENTAPSGNLSLRIAPEDLKKLFDHVGKAGTILQHSTDSEDKTATVIDVEAKLKNLTQFRDRLRGLLAKQSAALKDVIEVERELARVQAELDSYMTQQKILANETEKVAVRIELRSQRSIAGTGVFGPIAHAWRDAGSVLSTSVANLLTFVIAVIPWLLLLVPVIWLAARGLRKVLRRRAQARDGA